MSAGKKLTVTVFLLLGLAGLAALDAITMSDEEWTADVGGSQTSSDTTIASASSTDSTASAATAASTGGVAKQSGKPVDDVIVQQGFTTQQTTERTLLAPIVSGKAIVHTVVVLKDGDRAGSVTWVESPQVKFFFIGLKEALISAFSANVKSLTDMTLQEAGKPVRNVLTFEDRALGEEAFAFVRVRERLFEFHIAKAQEASMQALIGALTE